MALVIVLVVLARAPLPGRGPSNGKRDSWRSFKFGARHDLMARAGGRCEGTALLFWGRCSRDATEGDHIYPWSKGGPTVLSNGQALCRPHNRAKGSMTPPWWYVRGLEKRRARYFPPTANVRVLARMNDADRRARQQTPGRSRRR